MGRHLTRWLIPLPAILLAFWPTTVQAEAQPGLNTTYYTINEIPPLQSTSEYPICGSEIENNINRNYDYELYEDCTYDLFMVHMTGYITLPEHQTIEFMIASDDGGEITIGDNTFGVVGSGLHLDYVRCVGIDRRKCATRIVDVRERRSNLPNARLENR